MPLILLVNPSTTFPASFSGKVLRKQQLRIAGITASTWNLDWVAVSWQTDAVTVRDWFPPPIITVGPMKMTCEEAKFSLFSNNQGNTRKVELSELSWRSSKSQFDISQFVHTYFSAFTGPVRFCCRAKNQYTVPGVMVERFKRAPQLEMEMKIHPGQ